MKRSDPDPNPNPRHSSKDKRKWTFVKSYREKEHKSSSSSRSNHPNDVTTTSAGDEDANKHAIAVAAATAAVAEAAVAAAQAAAAVVRLTNSGRCSGTLPPPAQVSAGGGEREVVRAAVVIQSYFRGYLARRALRALKGLVKLQALVRGHIMRKKTAETMRCMQAMLRAQARARSVRAYVPESPHSSCKSSQINHPGPPTPEKFEQIVRAKISKQDQSPKIKRNLSRPSSRGNLCSSSWSDPRTDDPTWDLHGATSARTHVTDEDRADKILEVDTVGRPHFTNLRRKHPFDQSFHSGLLTVDHHSYTTTTSKDSNPGSCEVVQSLNPLKLNQQIDDDNGLLYCTAENSPQCYSATSQGGSSRRGPFTPTKSDGSRSFLSGFSDCPSYMAYTESSKAKMRSMSAPKQRPQYERGSSWKRFSVHGLGEHNPRSNPQRSAAMHASFTSKAYPGSGRLDRLGMPVKDSTVVYYSGYLN